jgi:hypothetical protein
VSENQQEAAAIVALSDTIAEMRGKIAAALDAAEARGRAEMAAELRTPCRHCSSRALLDGWHAYGQRKCCPDCDHRDLADEADREARPEVGT